MAATPILQPETLAWTNEAYVSLPSLGAADPYPSDIEVSGVAAPVQDLRVKFEFFWHDHPDDLDLLLVNPSGQNAMLMSDAGGGELMIHESLPLVLDDSASQMLPDETKVPDGGVFRPTDYEPGETMPSPAPAGPYGTSLSALAGASPNGTWSLYLAEDANPDSIGELMTWALELDTGTSAGWELHVPTGTPYLVKVQLSDGAVLWALTPPITQDETVTVSVDTTYQSALVFAALGSASGLTHPPEDALSEAGRALDADLDRMVQTVKRIVDHAVLNAVDYSLYGETRPVQLRAFGGGLNPVRSLDAVVAAPETDFIPYVYARRILNPFLPSNLLITELETGRWDYRVQGQVQHDGGPHVTHGGQTLVFDSDRDSEACGHPALGIYTLPLASPADTPPVCLTSGGPACENHQDPAWSWDEQQIAFDSGPPPQADDYGQRPYQILVMNRDGSGIHPVTTDTDPQVRNLRPRWSPDNRQIVYSSNRTGDTEVWLMNADGSGQVNLSHNPASSDRAPSFSPDGRRILFVSNRDADGDPEIFVMDHDGGNVRQLTFNTVIDDNPSWAHDGLEFVVTRGNSAGTQGLLVGLSALTGEALYEMGDFAAAVVYDRPILAFTPHVLVPGKKVIAAGQYSEDGYVTPAGGADRLAGPNPDVQGAFEIKDNPVDPLSYNRHEIFNAAPYFVAPVMSWFP